MRRQDRPSDSGAFFGARAMAIAGGPQIPPRARKSSRRPGKGPVAAHRIGPDFDSTWRVQAGIAFASHDAR